MDRKLKQWKSRNREVLCSIIRIAIAVGLGIVVLYEIDVLQGMNVMWGGLTLTIIASLIEI